MKGGKFMQFKRLIIILLLLAILNPFPNAMNASANIGVVKPKQMPTKKFQDPSYPGYSLPRKIAIVYTKDPSMVKIAAEVYKSVSMIYKSTELVEIESWKDLNEIAGNDGYWIKAYYIPGTLKGIKLDEVVSWDDVAFLMKRSDAGHHIWSAGSTDRLKSFNLPGYVHIEGSDVIDAELSYFYTIWEIGDILSGVPNQRYQQAGKDFRVLGAEYFSRNMNNLVNDQIKPKMPLGQEDVAKKEMEFNKKMESIKSARIVPPSKTPSVQFIKDTTNQSKSELSLNNLGLAQTTSTTFEFSDIPLTSGIEGPASKVIDILLEILITVYGPKLGLSPESGQTIINAIKNIYALISDLNSNDDKKGLKDIIKTVLSYAPIPDQFKKMIPLLVDSFYLLRGNVEDTIDFGISTVKTLFGFAGDAINSSTLDSILSVTQTLFLNKDIILDAYNKEKASSESEGTSFEITSVVLDVLYNRLTNYTTYQFLSNLFGDKYSDSQIVNDAKSLSEILMPILTAFIKRDYSVLFDALPSALQFVVNKYNVKQGSSPVTFSDQTLAAINAMARFIHLAIYFYQLYSDASGDVKDLILSQKDTIIDLMKEFLPPMLQSLGIDPSPLADTIQTTAQDILDAYNDAAVQQIQTADELGNLLLPLVQRFGLPATMQQILLDALVLFGSITVPDIPEPNSDDIFNIVDQVLALDLSALNVQNGDISLMQLDSVSDILKDNFRNFVQSIFGVIALTVGGGPAQKILAKSEEFVNGKLIPEAKKRITELVLKSMTSMVQSFVIDKLDNSTLAKFAPYSDVILNLFLAIVSGDGQAVKSILQTLFMQVIEVFISKTLGIDISFAIEIVNTIYSQVFNSKLISSFNTVTKSSEELKLLVTQALEDKNSSSSTISMATTALDVFFSLKDMFTNTIDFIFQQLFAAITQFFVEKIGEFLGSATAKINKLPILKIEGNLPLKGASFIGLNFTYSLKISPNLDWKSKEFVQWLLDIVFKGSSDFSLGIGEFFKKVLSFLSITPIFEASLGLSAMSSGKGGLFQKLLELLGADLSIEGKVFFKLQLFSFTKGGFDTSGFAKLLEWGFSIAITLSRDFTLFDIVTGGAGGGALNKAAKYIGLDAIKITIYVKLGLEIIYIAAHNGNPTKSTLTFIIGLGASITIGFDLKIIGLIIKAGVDITLKFIQDLTGSQGFRITLDILFWASVTIKFLFFDWTGRFEFRPPGSPYDLLPKSKNELKQNAFGYDSDGDGLSDPLEESNPLLNPNSADTDGDGLNDKFELRVSHTDPSKNDTDGDGLNDFFEWFLTSTNPLVPDTDMDGINDADEVIKYGTSPISRDTDSDGLTDSYEINTAWNIEGITPSVTSVIIGGQEYNDHTDPLNPDTDGDGLLDGEEGEFGSYYGNPDNYPDGADQMLLFNGGYTSPLDNDTDDDSYAQYYDGSIAGNQYTRIFLRDMTDGVEVGGITVQTIEEGELVTKTFYTNPTNPDSDGDTGVGSNRQAIPGRFLNSDGYELTLNPATNPLLGDSDGDGLLDGLEGTLNPDRNSTTNPLSPDTDGDSLPDGLEFTLGTDPNNPDTDGDLVLDGDEVYIYHTSPQQPDTDFDGVTDGWELFISHSNPHSADSDADGISDSDEIFVYNTNPVDEDSDNDNLSDKAEIFEYETDPTSADSDGDGIKDGPEILVYYTDPNNIDSDFDSILYPDENGMPTFLWTDKMEIEFGTDPNSQDTDKDGILDSWEVYIAQGDIPGFKNIPLDPLKKDIDGDGYLDGEEMSVNVSRSLIYPYISINVYFPYGSSPVSDDTDGDGLLDNFEISNSLNPNSTDSDGDGLSDYNELFVYLTSPIKADTDGDGINDNDEVTAATNSTNDLGLNEINKPKYATSATNPDSDGDGWPDGLEVFGKDGNGLYNPYNPDVNNNGIKDGYERDYDSDGISDGDEFYTYNSISDTHGGFLDYRNPDSDFDGLIDSDEILKYGTLPYAEDTDFDGYSDSLELFVGTDPLVFTTEDEFLGAFQQIRSPVKITSPEHGHIYSENKLKVTVESSVPLDHAYFRYKIYNNSNALLNSTFFANNTWSENITLSKKFDVKFGVETWQSNTITFENDTTYIVEVYAFAKSYRYPTSDQEMKNVQFRLISVFTVNSTNILGLPVKYYFIGGGVLAGGVLFWVLVKKGVPKKIAKKTRRRRNKK